jgi:hypothetical protein
MKKILVFSILLLSAIAVTTGTTITTQIQPAYSQASHCEIPGLSFCVKPGQDPTTTSCSLGGPRVCQTLPTTHQDAGQRIGELHQTCSQTQPQGDCVVLPP